MSCQHPEYGILNLRVGFVRPCRHGNAGTSGMGKRLLGADEGEGKRPTPGPRL